MGKRVIAAAIAGTTIGWYDFFLFTGAVSLVLFPHAAPGAATPMLVLLAAGFAGRLAGAAVFGHVGDRLGRRATLVATLLTAGLPTAAIGLLPLSLPLGTGALILLTVLRLIQGAGLGGEWAGAVLIAMEWEPDRGRRGFIASLPQVGVPLGLLLAMGGLAAATLLPAGLFAAWGWRLPFLLGLPLVGICWVLRRGLPETPEFREWRERRTSAIRRPVWRVLRHHHHAVVAAARARLSADLLFYGVVAAGLALGRGATAGLAMTGAVVACAAAAVAIPMAGWLSDRHGRGPVYGAGIAALAVAAGPLFTMLGSGVAGLVLLALAVAALVHAVQYGPQAALIAESFPPPLRYAGAALSYQLGSVPAGVLVPVVSVLLPAQAATAIALGVVGCCLVSASALVPPRRLLATTAALAALGAVWLVVLAAGALPALLGMATDGHSTLWQWINNLGNVIALLTVAFWLISRLRARAS